MKIGRERLIALICIMISASLIVGFIVIYFLYGFGILSNEITPKQALKKDIEWTIIALRSLEVTMKIRGMEQQYGFQLKKEDSEVLIKDEEIELMKRKIDENITQIEQEMQQFGIKEALIVPTTEGKLDEQITRLENILQRLNLQDRK